MATEFNTGADASLNEAVKSRYEANADTNAFTDAEQTKLTGVATGATANIGALADKNTVATADIDNSAVTLAKLADMATASLLGRNTAGTGVPEVLSAAVARTLLDVLSATQLASTASGDGAALIGSEDVGGFYSGTTAEAQLQEVGSTLSSYGDIVTQNQATFVKKTEREVIVYDAGGSSTAARPTQSSDKMVIWFNHGTSEPTNKGTYDLAMGQGFGVANVNEQTGTTYTLALGDEGYIVDANHATGITVTIPANATAAFDVGAEIGVFALGAGTVTITAAAGVTLNGVTAGSTTIDAQYDAVCLRKTGTDAWVIIGAHAAVA